MHVRILLFVSLTALLVANALPAYADGVSPAVATPVQREQAQRRFVRGKDLMAKKHYEDALAEFQASHEIVASPNTRLQIARCLIELGKVVAAYAELGRTAVEAKELSADDTRYQRAYDAAIAERTELEPKVGFVSLTINNASDGTQVTVAGEEIRRAAWNEAAPVQPGQTEIVVSTPGHEPVKQTVSLTSGERTSLVIDAQSGARETPPQEQAPTPPTPPPPAPATGQPWMRTGMYVAGGVAAVGMVTFVVAGVMARSTYDDLNSACGGGPCPTSRAGDISDGKTREGIANVGLAFGLVGLAAGTTLFVLSLPGFRQKTSASLVVSPAYLGVGGNL
jgi:PEGA domain-containing protein